MPTDEVLYFMPDRIIWRIQWLDAAIKNAFNDARPLDGEMWAADMYAIAGEWCDD